VAGADEIGCTHVNIDRSAIDCKGGHRRSNPNRATTLIASLERSWPMVHHCVAFLEEAYARFMELPNHGPEVLPNVRIARSGGRYTREAGVRNCERELSTPIRKAVKELMIS